MQTMSQSSTTVKSTKTGLVIKLRTGDVHAPAGMTRQEVVSLISPFPVGSPNRTENIRNAIAKAKEQLLSEASKADLN